MTESIFFIVKFCFDVTLIMTDTLRQTAVLAFVVCP